MQVSITGASHLCTCLGSLGVLTIIRTILSCLILKKWCCKNESVNNKCLSCLCLLWILGCCDYSWNDLKLCLHSKRDIAIMQVSITGGSNVYTCLGSLGVLTVMGMTLCCVYTQEVMLQKYKCQLQVPVRLTPTLAPWVLQLDLQWSKAMLTFM
jgi:hypothetical protein